jgi:hypothetical protein
MYYPRILPIHNPISSLHPFQPVSFDDLTLQNHSTASRPVIYSEMQKTYADITPFTEVLSTITNHSIQNYDRPFKNSTEILKPQQLADSFNPSHLTFDGSDAKSREQESFHNGRG